MRYVAMIYSSEAQDAAMTEAERGEQWNAYLNFTQDSVASNVNRGGEALMPTSTATTVRVRDGKTMTTDGPFAETKEQLGGFYILECANLDEAIAWAAKIPGALTGSIEVRPIMEINN